MPRRYNIKWRDVDRKKLSNTVRQFNAKLTRTLKKHPEFEKFLPERITVADVKKNIETRNDYNREIKSLLRFLKTGAEMPYTSKTGIQTTLWERREIGIKVAVINRQRTAERKRANVSSFTGTMGSIQQNNLLPKKYNIDKIRLKDWNKFVQGVEKQVKEHYFTEKNIQYKNNYIQALLNIFNSQDARNIIEIINDIEPDDFINLFYEDPVLQLDFIYDPLEASLKADSIIEHLQGRGYGV